MYKGIFVDFFVLSPLRYSCIAPRSVRRIFSTPSLVDSSGDNSLLDVNWEKAGPYNDRVNSTLVHITASLFALGQ